MAWWDRLKAVFRREASDVRKGLSKVGKTLDDELARKERELAATPEERIEMILEEQQAGDARFRQLQERILGQTTGTETGDEVTATDNSDGDGDQDPGRLGS